MRVIQTTLGRLQEVLESLPKTKLSHSNYFLPGWALDKPEFLNLKGGGFSSYDPTSVPDNLEFYYESSGWVCINAIIVIDLKND